MWVPGGWRGGGTGGGGGAHAGDHAWEMSFIYFLLVHSFYFATKPSDLDTPTHR